MVYVFTQDDLKALTPESRIDNIRGELLHILDLNYGVKEAKNSDTLRTLINDEDPNLERFAASVARRFPFYPASAVGHQSLFGDLIHDLMRKAGV